MAECINFESYFRLSPYENQFIPENCEDWVVEEKWSVTPNVIQEISLVNEGEPFESYYYIDLEIVSELQGDHAKISKSERMASNNIKFLIKGYEYSCFETYCGTDVDRARNHKYRYKIILTPILQQLSDEIFRKPGKRTKIDLLGGLKTLSNDIASLKDMLFSDLIIYCGNKSVEAHRNILSARSTVFKKFLQGVEDKEVQSCLEIESEIVENKANSIKDGTCDESTKNDIDASAVHIEEESKVKIILNIESDINADETTNNDNGFTSIYAEKDVRSYSEIKSKGNGVSTEHDKNCTTINAEKHKVQNTSEIKPKISDVCAVQDSTNDVNDTTASCVKKGDEVQQHLGMRSEIDDYFSVDDRGTNDDDESANGSIRAEKDSEFKSEGGSKQNSFGKESGNAFNSDISTLAMLVKEDEEIQDGIEIASDSEQPEDGNDNLDVFGDKRNDVQSGVELQPGYASNNNEALPTTKEEDELQNELKTELGVSNDDSISLPNYNVLKVRLKKVDSSIFDEFMDFIYSGQCSISDVKKTKDLLIAAQDYGICDLEYKCEMCLRSHVSIETIDDIYCFASARKCENLKIYVLDYVRNKIIGGRRRNINRILIEQQGNDEIVYEEEMTTLEKRKWLKQMRNHPIYFKDILKLKKGKKIRQLFSRIFPETSYDDDDIMAECRQLLSYILSRI